MWPFNRKKKATGVPKSQNPPPVPKRATYGGYLGSMYSAPTPTRDNGDDIINTMAAFSVLNSMSNDDSCRHDHHHTPSHDHHSRDFSGGGGSFDGGGSSGGWDSGSSDSGGSYDSSSSSSDY